MINYNLKKGDKVAIVSLSSKYIEQRIEPSMEFKDINELFNRSVV